MELNLGKHVALVPRRAVLHVATPRLIDHQLAGRAVVVVDISAPGEVFVRCWAVVLIAVEDSSAGHASARAPTAGIASAPTSGTESTERALGACYALIN